MVSVAEGQQVFEGNDIMVLESMKMEVPVQSPCDGTVTWIKPQGETIEADEVIAKIDDGT